MLIYNLRRVMVLRGIDKPHMFLMKNGLAPSSASNMLKYYPVVFKVNVLEKLCTALSCTPNDLFEWREDNKTVVHDTHALRTLTKQKNDIQTTLRELPLDKLEKLGEMLAELKEEK